MAKIYIAIIALLISSPIFIFAQNKGLISYSLQLKGQQYENKNLDEHYKRSIPLTFLDSAKLEQIAKAYVNYVFNDNNKVLLASDYIEDYFGTNKNYTTIASILEPDKKNNVAFTIKGDTLYKKTEQKQKAYLSNNGDFEFTNEEIEVFNEELHEYVIEYFNGYKHNLIEQFVGINFYETWNYNNKKGIFNKNIEYTTPFIAFQREEYGIDEYLWKLIEVSFIANNAQNPEVLAKNIIYDVKIIPELDPDYIAIEGGLYYLESTDRNNIILGLLNNLKTGIVKAYLLNEDGSPNLKKRLKYKDAINNISFSLMENNDTIKHNKIENIYRFRFYEDWYFNPATFTLNKKVNGLSLIVGSLTADDETDKYNYFLKPKLYFKLN